MKIYSCRFLKLKGCQGNIILNNFGGLYNIILFEKKEFAKISDTNFYFL
jgi:hypothetical protein